MKKEAVNARVLRVVLTVSVAEELPGFEGEEGGDEPKVPPMMLFIPAGAKGRVMTTSASGVLVSWDWAQLGETVNQHWEWFVKPEHLVLDRIAYDGEE